MLFTIHPIDTALSFTPHVHPVHQVLLKPLFGHPLNVLLPLHSHCYCLASDPDISGLDSCSRLLTHFCVLGTSAT